MARKKNTPSAKSAKSAKSSSSKAGAISGVVKDAEFDELDAAMADTKVEGVTLGSSSDEEPQETDAKTIDDAEVIEDAAIEEVVEDVTDVPDEEPVAEVAPIVATPVVEHRSGFWGPLLGGALAAVIGFGGAIYFKAAEWPVFGGNSEVSTMIAAHSEKISELQASLDAAKSENATALSELNARIDDIPEQTAAPLPDDVQATLNAQREEMELLEASLEKMRALTQGQIETAQAYQENAANAEARAKARGALNALRSALETGAPFGSVVSEIAAATDVPEVLAQNAEAGILPATKIEEQFAESARSALSASLKETAGDSTTERLTFFLKDQLGARSLTPREGDDPDAILSRAEAATKAGDLSTALTLIDALPDSGKAELQNWASVAATRRDALVAFDALSDALNAN